MTGGIRVVILDSEITCIEIKIQNQIVRTGKCGLEFVQQACMPDFIECLGDIEENCRTKALLFEALGDLMDDAVCLMNG